MNVADECRGMSRLGTLRQKAEDEAMRLKDKTAAIFGGGQAPGETVGNGRATALLFAREGARVLVVDRDAASAAETVRLIAAEGGAAAAFTADVVEEAQVKA